MSASSVFGYPYLDFVVTTEEIAVQILAFYFASSHVLLTCCRQTNTSLNKNLQFGKYLAYKFLLNVQAAYHGVPIVGLPLFAEQPDNMARATEQGFGLAVSVGDAPNLAHNLGWALQQILSNPSFAGNASRVSRLIRATRLTPAEQAAGERNAVKASTLVVHCIYIPLTAVTVRCMLCQSNLQAMEGIQ